MEYPGCVLNVNLVCLAMRSSLFIFTAVKGKPHFAELSEIRFRDHLKEHEGKVYEIYLRQTKRSLSQNAYYWAWLEVVEAETGNKADDLHEYFRRVNLPPKFLTVMGKEVKVPRSTTELSKHEFGEYLDKCAAECGVPLLNPEEAGYITNY
jgi:hypothetical protein